MAPALYDTHDQHPSRDWFEGNTWFEPPYSPYSNKRRSPAKRLSDTLARHRDYRRSYTGQDTVRLVPVSPPSPVTPTKHNILEEETSAESYGLKTSPHIHQARRYLGLHPTAPLADHHNTAPHSDLPWPKIRAALREPFAEFWGTFTLVLFGDGAVAQVLLSKDQTSAPGGHGFGSYQSISWGFGLGLMLGVYVAGDSGAYLNPAATLTNCLLRKLPWRRFPMYLLAQVAGGFAAAAVIYANYITAIDAFEGGRGVRTVAPNPTATAGIFATYPQPFTSKAAQFFSEFVASAILMFVIFALKDDSNNGVAKGGGNWFPLALFFLMFGIGSCFGWETGFAINLARDFGPRLLSYFVGYRGVWSAGGYYFWIPMVAPFCGCATGGILYDLFIYTGPSPINTPWFGLYDFFHPRRTLARRITEHKREGIV
ncbi:aquaporin [Myriangium duriaei CBS 260.36]|uniref:Aquaporin n=1 Tax=Myriangium duriaei CBS 260.36 TaxID=1168546 RepID=A0A9P4MJ11_9PEZI|nr:aquaporin [Myriangium duriaei CBS 260.36]